MKTAILLLFAGLVAVQASNFRVLHVPQLVEYKENDDELFNLGDIVKNVGNAVHQAGYNIHNAVHQVSQNVQNTVDHATHNIQHTVNEVSHNVQNTVHQVAHNVQNAVHQVEHNIQNTVHKVEHNVQNAVHQVAHNVQKAVNQVGHNAQRAVNQAGHTANQIGHNIANTANHIGKDINKLKHAFEHGFTEVEKNVIRNAKPTVEFLIHAGGFADAEQAWKKVNWKTGHGLPLAIQRTAKDIGKLYNNLNTISGGRLNDLALHVADKVAIAVFPPSAAVIETGKVLFKVAGQLHDITTLVKGIETNAHRKDWGGVAIDSFRLFALIAQDFV